MRRRAFAVERERWILIEIAIGETAGFGSALGRRRRIPREGESCPYASREKEKGKLQREGRTRA